MRNLYIVAAVFLSVMMNVTAYSQSGNGRLSGTVDDPSGPARGGRTGTDAQNVMNHPEPNPAALIMNINDPNFGLFTGTNAKSDTSIRQASLRFNF